MKKKKRKSYRGLIRFLFVLSLFIASMSLILRLWIVLAAAVIAGFILLWNLMD